ncbi:uncharacterized protein LOC135374174 isoform X2 [Ornithodoros turicata]|uniref:uncharacterized protein LOC135374174 isoform X2 n=1 Tax=Ornithodoros turicata TaxID=34597 RepID=UPI00313980B7
MDLDSEDTFTGHKCCECMKECVTWLSLAVVSLLASFFLAWRLKSRPLMDLSLCTSPECLELDTSMQASLGNYRTACDDFYGYVCYAWNHSDAFQGSVLKHVELGARQYVEALEEENGALFGGMHHMFRACIAFTRSGAIRTRDILNVNEHINLTGWPQRPPKLKPRDLFRLIVEVDLRHRVGAWAWLVIDSSNHSNTLWTFLDVPRFHPKYFDSKLRFNWYIEYVNEVMGVFGGSRSYSALVARMERDVWSLTVNTTSTYELLSFSKAAHAASHAKHVKNISSFEWMQAFQKHVPVNDNAVMPFRMALFPILDYLLDAPSDGASAKMVTENIKAIVPGVLGLQAGFDVGPSSMILRKLSKLRTETTSDLTSGGWLTLKRWSTWHPLEASFLLNVLNLRSLLTDLMHELMAKPTPVPPDALCFYTALYSSKPVVRIQRQYIGIPLGATRPPLFHDDFPLAVKFAGLGTLFATALLRILGPEGASYSSTGADLRPDSWWSNRASQSFQYLTRCYGDQGSNEAWRTLLALKISWEAFARLKSTRHLGTFKNKKELFFASYCYFLCSRDDSTSRARCNLPLRNIVDFARVFSCSDGQYMASSKRCLIDEPSNYSLVVN